MSIDIQKNATDISLVQLVISIIIALSMLYVIAAVFYLFDYKPNSIKMYTTGAMTQVSFIVSILYLNNYYKPFSICKPSLSMFWWVLAGIITTSIINYPYKVLSGEHSKPAIYYAFIDFNLFEKIIYIILLTVIGPIIEEIFNRYYAYNILKDKYGVKYGILISSFIYMILHEKLSLLLFMFGVIFAIVYEKTKIIWASIIVHAAMNSIWFILIYYA